MSGTKDREPLSLIIKRKVRQRCGFGCVICGCPIYEYHHIYGYKIERGHVAEEITLLCYQHHGEHKKKLLPDEVVIQANKAPFNNKIGISQSNPLHFSGKICEILIGSNQFTLDLDPNKDTPSVPIIMIDSTPLLSVQFKNQQLLLGLRIFDTSKNLILNIEDNELSYSANIWDIEWVGQNLIIREASGSILIDIILDPPSRLIINHGLFLLNGIELLIQPEYAIILNSCNAYIGNIKENLEAGIIIGNKPHNLAALVHYHGKGINRQLQDQNRKDCLDRFRQRRNANLK